MEEEIDSSLGFMRYDYPEAVYSELRRVYLEALQKPQDLNARARELNKSLSMEQKILLGVQLYLLISRSANTRQQLVEFYLFMTNLGIASQAIDIVYQLNSEERPMDDAEFRTPSGQPLETLRIASRDPHDVLLRSLSPQCHVTSFRYQNLVLLKNTGTVPVLVRSRTLRPGDFSRLYPGERVVLEDASLDYSDFISYFNSKKNLTGTQLYLTFTDEGSAEISQNRSRGTNLRVSFGLGCRHRGVARHRCQDQRQAAARQAPRSRPPSRTSSSCRARWRSPSRNCAAARGNSASSSGWKAAATPTSSPTTPICSSRATFF